MKLWQKIFICTLIIVMIAVSSTSIIILKNNFQTSVERQISNTMAEHSYLISNIKNKIISQRLSENAILLSETQILELLKNIMNIEDTRERTSIALYNTEGNLLYNNIPFDTNAELINTVNTTHQSHRLILQQDDLRILLIGSPITLEKQNYIFVTASNISTIYEVYQEQLDFTKWFSIVVSFISALFLLILIKILLFPLARLNHATKQITAGNYTTHINVKGNTELSELAENMNIMADSIKDNVNLLSETAENRRQFINNLTHEMKTPLTSILGFSDILRIKPDITSEELSEYSGIIFDEAKRLKNLSGKLMELITVGETKLEFDRISSTELFSQIQLVLKPILEKNNISLISECDDYTFKADCELFKSMLLNIIENAVKASKSGECIYLTGRKDENYRIIIRDNGIGIPKEEINKITEPFYMVDKARSRQAGGAGLGLALCKRIAEIHHAGLNIDSIPGKGTVVTITLTEGDSNEI